ncbi:MAG: twin-arginine translocase subunit TatC [Gemmataceae bacterium]
MFGSDDEDDFFKETRMSFGDHIEVLRRHLWRAIIGLVVCMLGGFCLDAIGDWINMPNFGIGRPLMAIIKAPVREALEDFYDRRLAKVTEDAQKKETESAKANEPMPVSMIFSREELARIRGVPVEDIKEAGPFEFTPTMRPLDIYKASNKVQKLVRPPELSTLSATEGFMVYFKVSLIAGLVIASPWVFWQIWSFIAAGLYPHEKRYVHVYLPFSLGLFVVGVIVCQFLVMPNAVKALLWFNEFLGITPDMRLSEWLSLAIMLPVVFGLAFETPLIMMFLERIGLMDIAAFKKKRKLAWFSMAVFAAVITPTPDALTMMYMWVPMCLLYEFGILLCYFSPSRRNRTDDDLDVPQTDELVEV